MMVNAISILHIQSKCNINVYTRTNSNSEPPKQDPGGNIILVVGGRQCLGLTIEPTDEGTPRALGCFS